MILIGTSGYSFPDWVGPFYPEGTTRAQMLDYYVKQFPAVEVNATYYRIPPPSTLAAMERKTPRGFEFVVKTNAAMTHEGSTDPALYDSFRRAVEPVARAGKLSGYLAQFPWAFRPGAQAEEHLRALKRLLPEAPLFVEFRHRSWITDRTYRFLEDEGLNYVSVDEPDLPGLVPPIARATGDLAYVRLHGRNKENWWASARADRAKARADRSADRGVDRVAESAGEEAAAYPTQGSLDLFGDGGAASPARIGRGRGRRGAGSDAGAAGEAAAGSASPTSSDRYDYLYSEQELRDWAEKIRELAMKSKKTFVFFNNCHVGQAATGAKLMRRLLEGP
jgi:uncharacterized protein YecE (DUF72 family)